MDDRWTYLEGRRAGRPYAASLRTPLRPDCWPNFDHHVVISLGYAPHWRTGLPKPRELTRLQEIEDRMIDGLEGHGALVATETTDAARTVHLYIRAAACWPSSTAASGGRAPWGSGSSTIPSGPRSPTSPRARTPRPERPRAAPAAAFRPRLAARR